MNRLARHLALRALPAVLTALLGLQPQAFAQAQAQLADAPSCPALADKPDPRLHTLYIDEQGWLLDPVSRERIAGAQPAQASAMQQLAASVSPEAQYVQAMLDRFMLLRKACPGLQLTVFVHGGLNTFKGAAQRTNLFSNKMLTEGHYPVFIGWNSGPFTNYFDHLFRIRKGERKPLLAPLTAPLVLAEDLVRSLVHLPAAFYKEVHEGLTVSINVDSQEEGSYQKRRERLEGAGFQVVSGKPHVGVGSSYWSVANPLKLVTAPLLDGLGSGAWDSMLRRTDLVLSKSSAFEDKPPMNAAEYADTAATVFLQRWVSQVQPQGVAVNLIGHSMGAIVVTNILARHPHLLADNVVFMGGAARIKDVENVLVPWLANPLHAKARFYNLSLDPYNELAERGFYDSVPRGSLLNWIDGIFGEVNSFKDRTVGGWWNITRTAEDVFRVHGMKSKLAERVTLKRFAIGDDQGPQTHGAFDDYCFWQPAFWADVAPPRKFAPDGVSCSRH